MPRPNQAPLVAGHSVVREVWDARAVNRVHDIQLQDIKVQSQLCIGRLN